jgi:hypothetical protein
LTVSAPQVLINGFTYEEAIEYISLRAELDALQGITDHSQFADDAEGFIENVLHEYLTDDLREICRSVVKYPVTIAQSGNGTGKSWIEARLALWFYKCRQEPQVYCAAAPPQTNLENILWAEIAATADKHPQITKDSSSKNLKIERSPREFIAGVAIPSAGTDAQRQARFSGKHAPSLLFLVDEGDAVPDPVYAGIETCLSGGFDRLLITFNPRERRGAVYRMIKEGKANVIKLSALNHPNVVTGEELVPGAVTRDKTVRRISQWCRPVRLGEVIDKTCFKLPKYLEGCTPTDQQGRKLSPLVPGHYKILEHQFSHVVLGEYPAQADNQLISEEWIDKARSRYDLFVTAHGVIVPDHIRCAVGLDIADHGVDHSVMCKRFGNFVHPLVSWSKQDVIEVGDLCRRNLVDNNITNLAAIYCDGTGVGAGTAPYITKAYSLPAVKVMVAWAATDKTDLGEFGILLDQLMWEVREWLRTDQAMLPPDADLIEELLAFNYEIKAGKVKVSSTDEVKELLKRSPDRARALMFSFMKSGFFSKMDLS